MPEMQESVLEQEKERNVMPYKDPQKTKFYNQQYYREHYEKLREQVRQYRARPDIALRLKQYHREYYARTHQKSVLSYRKLRRKIRDIVLEAYGNKCACPQCPETMKEFLSIDHRSGGGNAHRRSLNTKSSKDFYRWLRDNNFPPAYQLLCYNCNHAKYIYGSCPHVILSSSLQAHDIAGTQNDHKGVV